jgi:hypothetical protein
MIWMPISAGRNVGYAGSKFGGSSIMSEGVRTRLAMGPNRCKIWYKESRMWLWRGVLDADVQEKRWSPYGSSIGLV